MPRNLVLILMLSGCVMLTGCRGASRRASTDTGMKGHHDTFERLESYPLPGPQQVQTGRRPSPNDPFIQAQMQGPVPQSPPPNEGLFKF